MYGVKFSRRLARQHAIGLILIGLLVAGIVSLVQQERLGWTARLDHLLLDTFLRASAIEPRSPNTLVVDIDDVSLAAIGQWPWPRYRTAALVSAIAAGKPAAIGVDVLFPEPDRTSLVTVQKAFKRDFDVDIAFSGAPPGLQDNDAYLGQVLSDVEAVGAEFFYFDHTTTPEPTTGSDFRFTETGGPLLLHEASGVLRSTPQIAARVRFAGFINNQSDPDGRLRRLPLLIRHEGAVHPHLALATVMRALGIANAAVESERDGAVIRIAERRIPIDDRGAAILRFDGAPSAYPSVSALSVLNGSVPASDIAGKIVFVGSSAAGLNDLHSTAFDPQFPGLKAHAAMAEQILVDRFVREPRWSRIVIPVICLIAAGSMAVLFISGVGATWMTLGSLAIGVTPLLLSIMLFAQGGRFVSAGAPVIVTALLFVTFFAMRFSIERRQSLMWFKRLENARQVTIESMAAVAETRDPETGAHIKRTQYYVKTIAEELRRTGWYTDILTPEYIDLLFISAPLHDIGKVGVPDHILLKPARLTPEEFEIMKRHAEFGREIIFSSARLIEGDNFLILAGEIAATHHEKWDGTGYPAGLAGNDIPLSGRIMAVADIYDALISRRCYKEPFSHDKAVGIIREGRGTTFDPVVIDAFFAVEATVIDIAARYQD